MGKITTAVFEPGSTTANAYGLWQYDYGQALRIQGLNLPSAVEIHFSLQESGGTSVSRVGVTKDGVTDVIIPDSMLENDGATRNYDMFAFVYLTDDTSGQTEYKIKLQVKSRPKPEAPGGGENPNIFQEAVQAVQKSADKAAESEKQAEGWAHGREDLPERAQDNARYYAGQTAADAKKTEADRKEVERLVESVSGIDQQVATVENLTKQAQTSATNAALSEQAAKTAETNAQTAQAGAETAEGNAELAKQGAKASEQAVEKTNAALSEQAAKTAETNAQTAQAGAETAEGNAELAKQGAKASEQAVEKVKQLVTQMGQEVLDNKNHVDQTVQAFTLTAQQAVADINNAGQTQTERVEGAGNDAGQEVLDNKNHVDQTVQAFTLTAQQAVADINNAGQTQTERVEGAGNDAVESVKTAQGKATQAVQAFTLTAQQAVADINNAGQTQTERVEGAGNDAVESVKTAQGKATQEVEIAKTEAVKAVQTEGTTQTGNVSAEGEKQVQAVQQAAQEIVADREQIQKNKAGIEAIKQGKADAIVETASGEIIQAEDSSGLGFEGLRIFGKSMQDGVPSPESPVPIASAGDKGTVGVNVFGVNLINFPEGELINNGITYTSSKGAVEVKGKTGNSSSQTDTGALTCVLPKKLKGIFYLSGTSSNVLVNIKSISMDGVVKYFGKGKITLDGYEKEVKVYIRVDPNKTVNETVYPMVNMGNMQLPWEPYRTPQTLALATPNGLPGIKVDKDGNYTDPNGQQWICDEIDLERGKYVQRVGKYIFDGTETSLDIWLPTIVVSMRPDGLTGLFTGQTILSNYGTSEFSNNGGRSFAFNSTKWGASNGKELTAFFKSKYDTGKPVEVQYILASPVEHNLTPEEIAAYKALHTNYPTTVISNDESAHMEVSYVADTKNYIASKIETPLQKQITDLQNALISQKISGGGYKSN